MLGPGARSARTAEISLPTRHGELRITLLRNHCHNGREFSGRQNRHGFGAQIFGKPTFELPGATRLARNGTRLFTAAVAIECQRQKAGGKIGQTRHDALATRFR